MNTPQTLDQKLGLDLLGHARIIARLNADHLPEQDVIGTLLHWLGGPDKAATPLELLSAIVDAERTIQDRGADDKEAVRNLDAVVTARDVFEQFRLRPQSERNGSLIFARRQLNKSFPNLSKQWPLFG